MSSERWCRWHAATWGRSRGLLWVDGALGAAGAATALTLVLRSAFSGVGGSPGAIVVSLGYPLADVLLLALICGILAVRGVRGGSMWLWLAVGLAIFVAADVTYVLRVQSGSFAIGTVLTVAWMAGITTICLAIWRPERPRPTEERRPWVALVVPMLATLAGVGALAIFSIGTSPLVVVLATLTLVLAAGRTLVSFHQIQALATVRRQARTDELTGLGNRRDLFEAGEVQLQAVEPGERLVLLLLDLDNFKLVNDTLGHQCGDELLCEASRRLAGYVRRPDLVTRLGGDEFALLVGLGADGDGHRARGTSAGPAGCARHRRRRPDPHRRPASGSPGDGSDVTIVELLRRADVAMYAAKVADTRAQDLRRQPRRREPRPARDDRELPLRAPRGPVRAALPAEDRHRRRRDGRGRGARALAAPDARAALPGRVPDRSSSRAG